MITIRTWGKALFTIQNDDGTTRAITVSGRDRWALQNLLAAGPNGCTPLDHPGPRWSAYTFNLRHEYGLEIETVTEQHGGPFQGNHARYVLRSHVTFSHEVQQ